MRIVRIGIPLVLVFAALVGPSQAWGGRGSKSNPAIAFTRDGDLMVMDADGKNVKTVKSNAYANSPSWSPDGTKIAYMGGASPNQALYVINVSGSGLKKLFSGYVYGIVWSPAPAPDGKYKIAFGAWVGGAHADLHLINTDGTGLKNLTPGAKGNKLDLAWSPDATRIAANVNYVGDRPTGKPRREIAIFDLGLDGSGAVTITGETSATDVEGSPLKEIVDASINNTLGNLDWSRGGGCLVLSVYVEGASASDTEMDLWTIDLDDLANPTQVTNTSGNSRWESAPGWSPDDSRIVCTRVGTGVARDIATMDTDGTGVTALITGNVYTPDWKR